MKKVSFGWADVYFALMTAAYLLWRARVIWERMS
jgi:hypothetical protein